MLSQLEDRVAPLADDSVQLQALIYDHIEQLRDPSIVQHWDLHIRTLHALAKFCDFKLWNLSLFFKVDFICRDDNIFERLVIIVIVLVDPLEQIVETLDVGDVEN